MTDKPVEKDDQGNDINTDDFNELWDSDPECVHHIVLASGGGIRCNKCNGWCCF